MVTLVAQHPQEYLGVDDFIDHSHPEVQSLARNLRRQAGDDLAYCRTSFEWVRDEVAHALDEQDPRITITASDALRERVGLCFAKSHLLAALLRAEGIPTGLCYQRLRDRTGFVLHGLVATHIDGEWHRLDPRGNKPGVDARFSLQDEHLAFTTNSELDELDYPTVFVTPSPRVVNALTNASDTLALCAGGLPDQP